MTHASTDIIQLTDENFDAIVGPSSLVIIDFTADWCEPCQAFKTVFADAASEYPDAIFAQINVGEQEKLASSFNVRSVPTIMILRHNVAVFMQPGAITAGELKRLVEEAQALDMETIRQHIEKTVQGNGN